MNRLSHFNTPATRSAAAKRLAETGAEAIDAIPALLEACVATDDLVRKAAKSALESIDALWYSHERAVAAVPQLIKEFDNHSLQVRRAAIGLVAQIGHAALPDLVRTVEKRQSTLGTVCALQILEEAGNTSSEALSVVITALEDPSTEIRIAAAEALPKFTLDTSPALPALIGGLAADVSEVRQKMAESLSQLDHDIDDALPALLLLMCDPDDQVRKASIPALQRLGAKTLPYLIEMLRARDEKRLRAWHDSISKLWERYSRPLPELPARNSRHEYNNAFWSIVETYNIQERLEAGHEIALRLLGEYEESAAENLATVIECLSDRKYAIQLAAVDTIGRIGQRANQALPHLVMFLFHEDADLREHAFVALNQVNPAWRRDSRVVESINKLKDRLSFAPQNYDAVLSAFVSLEESGIPLLEASLGDNDRIMRENAARILGDLGALARSSIPVLENALRDPNRWVSEAAAEALSKIREAVKNM